jgi:hypothetical protein
MTAFGRRFLGYEIHGPFHRSRAVTAALMEEFTTNILPPTMGPPPRRFTLILTPLTALDRTTAITTGTAAVIGNSIAGMATSAGDTEEL